MSKSKRKTLTQNIERIQELGLWPPNLQIPDTTILQRIERLDKEIRDRRFALYLPEKNKKSILRNLNKQYETKSKVRRNEHKVAAIALKQKKLNNWNKFKTKNFIHLGRGVSNWLNYRKQDNKKIKSLGLPLIKKALNLPELLETDFKTLKWLSYHSLASRTCHYLDFRIPKRSGGFREISKPKSQLDNIQVHIKSKILDKLLWENDIHGFIKSRSNLTNAKIHENSRLFVNVDIKDFFPSIRFAPVRKSFHSLGYSGEISTILALLVTKPKTQVVTIGETRSYVNSSFRYLPQGSRTSPQVANLVFRPVDHQLRTRSKSLNFVYSRYADDLTFSSWTKTVAIKPLLYMIYKTLDHFDYKVNKRKFKILGQNDCQEVTGLTMNEGVPLIPREWRRNVRAGIHQAQFLTKDERELNLSRLAGCLSYMRLTHRVKAGQFSKKLNEIRD